MEEITFKLANTELSFAIKIGYLDIDDPYSKSIMYGYKLNGVIFTSKITDYDYIDKQDLLNRIVKDMLSHMLSRVAMPVIANV